MCICPWLQRLSSLLATSHGLRKPRAYKYHIRLILSTGYGTIDFIKLLKGYRATHARISNIKGRKKRREHRYCKLEKRRRN